MSASGRIAVLLGAVVLLGGCGSSGGASGSRAGGEAAKPAVQIVNDAAAAMRGAGAYVIAVNGVQNGAPVVAKVLRSASGAVEISESLGAASSQVIVLPTAAYLRASKAFLSQQGQLPASLAGRWLQIPAVGIQGLVSQLGQFSPTRLAGCIATEHGTLSRAGTTNVGGQPAVVVKDAGNLPGTQPSKLAVADSAPHYPLQLIVTGPRRAGGKLGACNNGTSSATTGTLTLSDFGDVPPITVPAHAIRLG